MADAEFGTGYVSIVPEARKVDQYLRKDLPKALAKAGVDGGRALGEKVTAGLKRDIGGLGTKLGKQVSDELGKGYDPPTLPAPEVDKPVIPEPDVPEIDLEVRFDSAVFAKVFSEVDELRGDLLGVAALDISDPITKLERDLGSAASSRAVSELQNELREIANKASIDGRIDIQGAARLGEIRRELDQIGTAAKSFRVDVQGDVDIDLDVDAESDAAGGSAGNAFLGGFAGAAKGGPIVAAAAAVVAGIGFGVVQGLQGIAGNQAIEQSLAASLRLNPADADKAADVVISAYIDGFGDSKEELSNAVRNAIIIEGIEAPELRIQKTAESLVTAEDIYGISTDELSVYVRNFETLANVEPSESLDRFFAAAATLPLDQAGEYIELVNEYAPTFEAAGLSQDALTALTLAGLGQTNIAADKYLDSVKEIRNQTRDGLNSDALKTLGIDAKQFQADLESGNAAEALGEIADSLLAIENPALRSATAIEIFGAPLEDVDLDSFLTDLAATPEAFSNSAGAAEQAEIVYDTLGQAFTQLGRSIKEGALADLEERFGPALDVAKDLAFDLTAAIQEDGLGGGLTFLKDTFSGVDGPMSGFGETLQTRILPAVTSVYDSVNENLVPVLRDELWPAIRDDVLPILKDFAGFIFNDVVPALVEFWAWTATSIIPVLADLASFVATKVIPAMADMYDVFKTQILPVLRDVWAFINANILPVMADMHSTFTRDIVPAATEVYDALVFITTVNLTGITNAFKTLKNRLDDVRTAANFAKDAVNGIGGFAGRVLDPTGAVRKHDGGTVYGGATGTEVSATLLAGEEVLSIRDAKVYRAALQSTGQPTSTGGGGDWNFYLTERPLHEEIEEARALAGVG